MFEAVPVPFGREEIDVALLAVLVWKASRLLNVALVISPVMRWAVDEKVRLPVETVAEVNVPAAADEPPIATLFIVPAVAGLIVTTPVPVGASETLALAGLRETAPEAERVVNAPVEGVVAPMVVLLIVPLVRTAPEIPAVAPAPTKALTVIFLVSVALVSTIGRTSVDADTSTCAREVSWEIFLSTAITYSAKNAATGLAIR